MQPLTIGVFLAVAVAVKLCVLAGLCVAVLRRVERSPVSGVWALQASEHRATPEKGETSPLTPLAGALMSLVNRDMSQLEITPSGRTLTVRSADGRVLSYGTNESRVTRCLDEDIEVQPTWSRHGEALRLEFGVRGEGEIIELFERDGSRLKTETRVTVPACGLDRSVTRLYVRKVRQV